MPQINQRTVVLLNAASITTNGVGPDIVLPAGVFSAATLTLANSSNTGTTQTLDVYLQRKLRQAGATDVAGQAATAAGIYDDLLHFAQVTTTTVTKCANLLSMPLVPTANSTVITTVDYAPQDAALAAGAARVCQLGGTWRVKYVTSGTTPVYSFSVVAELTPFGG